MQNLTSASLRSLLRKTGRHGDGGGLYFRVIGGGKAYWTYRYRIGGKERETSIGPYPEITLEEARDKHAALRKQVRADKIDPLAQKSAAKAANATPSVTPTFGAMADLYIANHETDWRNAKHRWQWSQTLTEYCAAIRDKPVDQVGTSDILAVLTPIWTTKQETASRLRGRIEVVLDAARALDHIDKDRANPARWKGHLDKLLSKRKKLARGHHAAMPYKDVPAFMATLSATSGTAAKALAFVILTAARSGEALGMTWDEVEFIAGRTRDASVWTVPADRMKAGKTHRVPLSEPALAILLGQMAERGKNPHVFPGDRPKQPLSNMSLLMLLRRMKTDVTVHGFRSAFRDWAGDETNFQREVMEAALAHAVGSAVEAAYRRPDALQKRRELMAAWATYVMPPKPASKAAPIRTRERV